MRYKELSVGVAVGSGIVARAAEEGGADFLLALAAGRLRNMGAPSIACMLPITDANALTMEFAGREILPQSRLPVYLGMTCWNPGASDAELARQVLDHGFHGAANFPTCVHFSEGMARVLDAAGIGIRREIAMLEAVKAEGGATMFYCGTRNQARMAADAGLDAIVFNYGWNVGGSQSHLAEISLEEAAFRAREVARYVRESNKEIRVFLEGGPILTADDLTFVASQADIDGYVGGSTIDRFPVQNSVVNQIAEYKMAKKQVRAIDRRKDRLLEQMASFGLHGRSPAMVDFLTALHRAASGDAHIALTGESGSDLTGAVDAIAALSNRPQIAVFDFSEGLSPDRINRTLFGQVKGDRIQPGLLGATRESLLVLLSCELMPALVRKRLTSAVRNRRLHPVGSRQQVPLNTRVVFCATGQDTVLDGGALQTIGMPSLRFPPLRERHFDLRMLLDLRLDSVGLSTHYRPRIETAAYRAIAGYDWPGNETELARFVDALAQVPTLAPIGAKDIKLMLSGDHLTSKKDETSQDLERAQILDALVRNGFRKGETAKALSISRKTLYNRMRRYGIS